MNIGVAIGRAAGNLAGSLVLTLRAHHSGQLLKRLYGDQKQIWSCPRTIYRGAEWKMALAVTATTAGLIFLDPYGTPYLQQPSFQDLPAIRVLNRILSGRNMAILINAVPLSFFIAGLTLRRPWLWQTALLAAESAADAEIVAITMKHLNRRMRPSEVGPGGDYLRTWFLTKNRGFDGTGGFPSGHTASSFAIATVFAERYPTCRWYAFAAAGIIGASRLHARAHFPSDVFFGAALGFSISHFVVMPRSDTARA